MTNEKTQALVPIKVDPPKTMLPTRGDLQIIGVLAKNAAQVAGHAVPKELDTPAKAAAVMIAGFELGVKPMTSLRHIFVVNGRTEPDAQLMAGIVTAHEPTARFEIVELTDKLCTMRLHRPARDLVGEYTYELADAERAGLLKRGGPWRDFPKDMMRWAATKRLCRAYAPDLVNSVGAIGVADTEELLQVTEEPELDLLELGDIDVAQQYNEGDEPTEEREQYIVEDEPAPEPQAPANEAQETGELMDGSLVRVSEWGAAGGYLNSVITRQFNGDARKFWEAFADDADVRLFLGKNSLGPAFNLKTRTEAELRRAVEAVREYVAARAESVGTDSQ